MNSNNNQFLEQVDVLIVTAIKLEYDALLKVDTGAAPSSKWEHREGPTGFNVAFRSFRAADGGMLRVAATYALTMGGVAAAGAAAPLVNAYQARYLAMCGVCAGRKGHVCLGDVIIGDRLWSYDTGETVVEKDHDGQEVRRFKADQYQYQLDPIWTQRAESFMPEGQELWLKDRPYSYEEQRDWLMEFLLAGNSPKNNAYAEERRRRCADYAKVVTQLRELGFLKKTGPISLSSKGRKYIKEKVEIHLDGLPERKDFAIHVGPIGSGTTVQRDPHIFDKLSEQMRKVIGLEMEASAIGAIAHTLRKEMIVMKGVMDYADQDKNDNFKKFAARASAECLVAFLRQNLPEFHAPKANPVQRTRPSGTGNLQTDLLGQDIVRGEKALDSLTKSGADAVPGVLEWLKFSDGSLPRTHRVQLFHRFKKFFAAFPQRSFPILVQLTLDGETGRGYDAAACFDYFSDEDAKVLAANTLAERIRKEIDGVLLDNPNPVRNALLALGYLGARDWRYLLRDVLVKARSDRDEKFRRQSLQSAALMIAKVPQDSFGVGMTLLSRLFDGFGSGEFSPERNAVTEYELRDNVKRFLRRRKPPFDLAQLVGILENSVELWSHPESPNTLVCAAHLLGGSNHTAAIAVLAKVLKDPAAPENLRAECARSLGRIRKPPAVASLRDAVQHIARTDTPKENSGASTVVDTAIVALLNVAQYGENPVDTLQFTFAQWGVQHITTPLTARAVGQCGDKRFESHLLQAIQENRIAGMRGQSGLALARLEGSKHRELIEESLKNATSDLEAILLSLAVLLADGLPNPVRIQECLRNELFEWPTAVAEDAVSILDGSSRPYQALIKPWKPILAIEPDNLLYLE